MSGHGNGWANPAPAGLVALAVACFTFYALLSGKVEHTCIPLLGCWLLGGALVQFTVAIVELKEGASTGGNVFLFFSAFFMLVGGLEFFVKYFASINGWAIDARIDGWSWMVLWFALWLWTPAYFKAVLPMTLVVLSLDIAVPIVSLMDLGILDHAYAPTAALFLLISGILGIYVASAVILAAEYGKSILPLPGPIVKPSPSSSANA